MLTEQTSFCNTWHNSAIKTPAQLRDVGALLHKYCHSYFSTITVYLTHWMLWIIFGENTYLTIVNGCLEQVGCQCIERVALGLEKLMWYRFKLSLSWNICWHVWSKSQHACQLDTQVWSKSVQWFSCVVYLHCLYYPLPLLIFTRSGMSSSQESQYRWDQSTYRYCLRISLDCK